MILVVITIKSNMVIGYFFFNLNACYYPSLPELPGQKWWWLLRKKIIVYIIETVKIFSLLLYLLRLFFRILSFSICWTLSSINWKFTYVQWIPDIYTLHQQFCKRRQWLYLSKMQCKFTMELPALFIASIFFQDSELKTKRWAYRPFPLLPLLVAHCPIYRFTPSGRPIMFFFFLISTAHSCCFNSIRALNLIPHSPCL